MTSEGDPLQFFVVERDKQEGRAVADREMPDSILNLTRSHGRISREDLNEIIAQGFSMDNDNKPVPENNNRCNNCKSVRDCG